MVAAAIASAAVIRMCVQARAITAGMLQVDPWCGLKSLASATAAPRSINMRAGANPVSAESRRRAGG